MNAVEKLEAAIEKLEADKASYVPGPHIDLRDVSPENTQWFLWALPLLRRDQRSIDAQLAILRHVLAHYRGDLGISTNRHVVALADAILGEA